MEKQKDDFCDAYFGQNAVSSNKDFIRSSNAIDDYSKDGGLNGVLTTIRCGTKKIMFLQLIALLLQWN